MNQNIDLFVQAFWVKCREIIRPEIDKTIGELRGAGHDANVATQEYSALPDPLPVEVGPSVTLSLVPKGTSDGVLHPAIQFHGDVANETIEVQRQLAARNAANSPHSAPPRSMPRRAWPSGDSGESSD
jgi:hypothetical protein